MGDITRNTLYLAWRRYYGNLLANHSIEECQQVARDNTQSLVRKMRIMGRQPGYQYKEFDKPTLNRCLSAALSCHQQVLRGLSSSSWGGKLDGWREGVV